MDHIEISIRPRATDANGDLKSDANGQPVFEDAGQPLDFQRAGCIVVRAATRPILEHIAQQFTRLSLALGMEVDLGLMNAETPEEAMSHEGTDRTPSFPGYDADRVDNVNMDDGQNWGENRARAAKEGNVGAIGSGPLGDRGRSAAPNAPAIRTDIPASKPGSNVDKKNIEDEGRDYPEGSNRDAYRTDVSGDVKTERSADPRSKAAFDYGIEPKESSEEAGSKAERAE